MAAASYDKRKFFMEPEFDAIPAEIKKEVQTICVYLAEKLTCTFIMGFYETGEIYFETVQREGASDFDDIGAELEIKALRNDKAELLKALSLWYKIYKTPEGESIKSQLFDMNKNKK